MYCMSHSFPYICRISYAIVMKFDINIISDILLRVSYLGDIGGCLAVRSSVQLLVLQGKEIHCVILIIQCFVSHESLKGKHIHILRTNHCLQIVINKLFNIQATVTNNYNTGALSKFICAFCERLVRGQYWSWLHVSLLDKMVKDGYHLIRLYIYLL